MTQQTFAGMPVAASRIRITLDIPLLDDDGSRIEVGHGDMISGHFSALINDVAAPERMDKEGNLAGVVQVTWKATGVESLCEIQGPPLTRSQRDEAWRDAVRNADVA